MPSWAAQFRKKLEDIKRGASASAPAPPPRTAPPGTLSQGQGTAQPRSETDDVCDVCEADQVECPNCHAQVVHHHMPFHKRSCPNRWVKVHPRILNSHPRPKLLVRHTPVKRHLPTSTEHYGQRVNYSMPLLILTNGLAGREEWSCCHRRTCDGLPCNPHCPKCCRPEGVGEGCMTTCIFHPSVDLEVHPDQVCYEECRTCGQRSDDAPCADAQCAACGVRCVSGQAGCQRLQLSDVSITEAVRKYKYYADAEDP